MQRKQFLLGALILPVIAACSTLTEKTKVQTGSSVETPLDDIVQSSIAENNSLIFGDANESRKITFILNLGNTESLLFLLSNLPSIRQMFENNEHFEILLTDLPSSVSDFSPPSEDLTLVSSAVAMYSYVDSPESTLNFLETLIIRWNEQETFVREDVVYLAQELELLPNIDISGINSISEEFVEKMTEKAGEFTDSSPAILVDNLLWDGNIENPIEIEQLFNPPVQ